VIFIGGGTISTGLTDGKRHERVLQEPHIGRGAVPSFELNKAHYLYVAASAGWLERSGGPGRDEYGAPGLSFELEPAVSSDCSNRRGDCSIHAWRMTGTRRWVVVGGDVTRWFQRDGDGDRRIHSNEHVLLIKYSTASLNPRSPSPSRFEPARDIPPDRHASVWFQSIPSTRVIEQPAR